jgi:hypothetical protein
VRRAGGRGGEEGRSGGVGGPEAHDNNQRHRGAGGSRGLGRSRAGHHGSGSPGPVGPVTLRPHLKSIDPASRPERGDAQGLLGNVVQTPRSFRRS